VSYDAEQVETAMTGLREKGVARVIHAGGGNRTTKYRHVLDEALGLDARELSLIAVLLLRGAQTLNELRTRTERMADFEGAADVERDLDRLADRDEPLVARVERQAGQKEGRFVTLLTRYDADAAEPSARAPRGAARKSLPRPTTPRLAALTDDEMDDEQTELLTGLRVGSATNIFRTFVRNSGLFRRWAPFGGKLLNGGKLDRKLRELAILRTAWLTQAQYEWGQHVPIAQAAGVTSHEIAGVAADPSAADWTTLERAVLRATDELHAEYCVTDATWKELSSEHNEKQLIELVFLVGHYHMLAFALNSFGVEREEGVVGLPD
jgi:uncharacterized protein YceH (UPF0502 family)